MMFVCKTTAMGVDETERGWQKVFGYRYEVLINRSRKSDLVRFLDCNPHVAIPHLRGFLTELDWL